MNIVRFPFYARFTIILLGITLTLMLLSFGSSLFIPLSFGMLTALLLYPLAKKLEHIMPRSIASLLAVLVFVAALSAFITLITVQVISFSQDIPLLENRINSITRSVQYWLAKEYNIDSEQQAAYLNKSAENLLGALTSYIQTIFLSVSEFAFWTIFVFIYAYFILYHRSLLVKFVSNVFPAQHSSRVYSVVEQTRTVINSYMGGVLTEMAIVAGINCLVLGMLGVKYALLLGILVAVLNLIPYIGIFTGIVLSMIVTLSNASALDALHAGIALMVVHFIDANILMPRIVGSKVKMNALVTIIAVLIGGLVWGVAGMFLFIPLMAMLKIVLENIPETKAWAMLMGAEEKIPLVRKKVKGKIPPA
jgi:predicted PurR-regulated permease PerM